MKHLGDITKISGYEVPIVDVVVGGSPCQDLSVAGKREGLAGERSGLFMEQLRIIKEMRDGVSKELRSRGSDEYIRPRYMVWENVPGAFSSNKGEDFRVVLEETARVADKTAVIPKPEGGWKPSGAIMGDGWSIAWRVHDAQFWGVPQRRKRIALVADFGGETAPEILFERKGVSGDFEESGKEGKGTAFDSSEGVRETGGAISFQERAGKPGGGKGILIQNERTGALRAQEHGHQPIVYGISAYESNSMKSPNPHSGIYEADTTRTLDNNGGNPACNQGGMIVLEGNGSRPSHKGDGYAESEVSYTLNAVEQHAACQQVEEFVEAVNQDAKHQQDLIQSDLGIARTIAPGTHASGSHLTKTLVTNIFDARGNGDGATSPTITGDHENRVTDYTAVCVGNGQTAQTRISDKVGALNCMHDQQAVITYGLDRAAFNQGKNAKFGFSIDEEKIGAQTAKGSEAVFQSVVRRLTPLECERLQGYPDGWTNIGEWVDSKGKKHKDADSPRYKALGNSIALPFWEWMAKRMRPYLGNNPTMASLFDGIGGFPLVFTRAGFTPVWASEIEEFPIAVTKIRFKEDV